MMLAFLIVYSVHVEYQVLHFKIGSESKEGENKSVDCRNCTCSFGVC